MDLRVSFKTIKRMRHLLTMVLMLITVGVYCQTVDLSPKEKKTYKKALKELRNGNTKGVKRLQKIIKNHPLFVPAYQKLAGYYYDNGDTDKALNYLTDAIAKDSVNYPSSYFYLANIYEDEQDYGVAANMYEKAASMAKKELRKKEALRLMELCIFRDSLIKSAVSIPITKLKGKINTKENEYLPVFTLDEQLIAFIRRSEGQEDIILARKDTSGLYSQLIDFEEVNTPDNEGMHTISADGKIIIYTSCGRKSLRGSCDLFFSFKGKNGWSKPKALSSRINTENWESQPSLSSDGKKLFFSSEREGGYGKRDLYYTELDSNMRWGDPVNIGSEINTKGNEEAPFIHPDGMTLYFTSDGHLGMGKKDIFMSRYDLEKNSWSIPTNLGYPINTIHDEGALSISLDGKTAFFASDQLNTDIGQKNLDILSFPLPERFMPYPVTYIKINTSSTDGDIVSGCKYDLMTFNGKSINSGFTDRRGEAIFKVLPGKNYNLTVSKKGYVFMSEYFKLDSIAKFEEPYLLEIVMDKIKVAETTKPVVLKNIFFKSGSAELLKESDLELENMVTLLTDNPKSRIKIIGHTDNVGKGEDNQRLSLDRANSVKRALVEKGILSERIMSEGRGETEPIASNDDLNGRKKNRRTEFILF